MSKQLTEAVATSAGERVIVGSVRPDGTVRKERRIRAGYTPQDEQPVYQSRGVLAKQNIPTCPGMDEAEIAALKQQAGKGKKPSGGQAQSAPKPKAAAAQPAPKTSQPAAKAAPPPEPAPAPAAPPSEPEDPKAALEKQIRNLKKKVRQCAELREKAAGGAALDKDQQDKVVREATWTAEMQELEAKLAALGV